MSRFVAGRYELKFLISHRQQERMLQEVERWVVPDTNGVDGCYRVTSQYYDTDDLQAYWEKLDGVNQRMKFRLRYYGGEPESPFFEIKHRQNRIIMKERVGLQKPPDRKLLSTEMGLDELSAGARPKNESELQFAKRLELLGQNSTSGPRLL